MDTNRLHQILINVKILQGFWVNAANGGETQLYLVLIKFAQELF